MTISEANVIAEVEASSPFSVQTSTQAATTPPTNTTATILYTTSSKKQGNFSRFLVKAQLRYAADIIRYNKSPSEAQQETMLGLLISSYQEQKDPDFAARSVSMSGYSITRADSRTGYEIAYEDFLDSLPGADISGSMSEADADGRVRPNDDLYYPSEWRLTQLHQNVKRSIQDANLIESTYSDPL